MKLAIPFCIALLLITASGIHRSSWSGLSAEEELERTWTMASDDARTKLNKIPDVLGRWQAVYSGTTQEEFFLEGMDVYFRDIPVILTREYVNSVSGEKVFLLIMYGKARRVSIHSFDDAYYSPASYSLLSRPEPIMVSTGKHSAGFRTSPFMKLNGGTTNGPIRIFWAWSKGGEWESPEYPRIAFEDATGLYKMYVFTPIDGDAEDNVDGDHPGIEFLEAFIATTDGFQSRNNSPE